MARELVSVRKSGAASSGSPQRSDRHQVAELRDEAVRMRLAGHRLAEIAKVVQRDVSTVSRWITTELDHRLETSVEELRAVEVERLDSYLVRLQPAIDRGDVKSINAALNVVEKRAKLLGLYAPLRVESTVITIEAIDLEMARLNAQLVAIEARDDVVPGEVLADDALPAITAGDPDAVGWGDPWAEGRIDGNR